MTRLSTRPSIGGDALSGRQRASVARHRYWEAVLKDDPVAFWPLNEPPGATLVKDWSGNGYDGAVAVGHQTLIFGEPGYTSDGATALRQASAFDSGDGIAVGSTAPALAVGTGPWTLEVAAGTYDVGDDPALIALGVVGTDQHGWVVYRSAGQLTVGDDQHNATVWTCAIDPSEAQMHHYAVTYDGAGGFKVTADAVALNLFRTLGAPLSNIVAPGLAVGSAFGGLWSGMETVADAAFYDYALTAAQIAAHVAAR